MTDLQFTAVLVLIVMLGVIAVNLGILVAGKKKGDETIIRNLQSRIDQLEARNR